MRCMLRDLRSRYVFAPVRPRLARWEYKGPRGTRGNGDISEARSILFITLVLDPNRLVFFLKLDQIRRDF